MADVLALTEVNHNACDYVSGLPVTLKFADRVGEILTASPRCGCPRAESRRDYQKASGEFTIIHGWDLPLRVIVARLVEAPRCQMMCLTLSFVHKSRRNSDGPTLNALSRPPRDDG
jgi:hypothetical protein